MRNCATQSRAFLALKDVYDNRDKAIMSLREKYPGKKIVWTFGSNVPDEILIAAGMIPVRAYGDHQLPRKYANMYLEASFSSIWRGLFEKLVGGSARDLCDLAVFSNTTVMIEKLYSYISALSAAEPLMHIPPLMYVEQEIFNPTHEHFRRNAENFEDFRAALEVRYGKKILDSYIREASRLCNANRQALREFAALRSAGRVSGSEALTVIGASLFMAKADSTKLIKEVTEDAKNWDIIDAKKVYYTGTCQETTELYEMVEAAGGNVVGEDTDWGDRHYDRDVFVDDVNIIHAVTARYMYKYANSERGLVRNREKAVPQRANAVGAEKFLLYMNRNDESFLWDYPSQKPYFAQFGIDTLAISKQVYPFENADAIKAEIAGFIAGAGREN